MKILPIATLCLPPAASVIGSRMLELGNKGCDTDSVKASWLFPESGGPPDHRV